MRRMEFCPFVTNTVTRRTDPKRLASEGRGRKESRDVYAGERYLGRRPTAYMQVSDRSTSDQAITERPIAERPSDQVHEDTNLLCI